MNQSKGASIEITILDAEGNPIPQHSPADLPEGATYTVRLTIKNNSTKGGVPCAATLTITLWAATNLITLIPTTATPVAFAAGETKISDTPMTIPMGQGGQPGKIGADVNDPAGIKIASVALPFTVTIEREYSYDWTQASEITRAEIPLHFPMGIPTTRCAQIVATPLNNYGGEWRLDYLIKNFGSITETRQIILGMPSYVVIDAAGKIREDVCVRGAWISYPSLSHYFPSGLTYPLTANASDPTVRLPTGEVLGTLVRDPTIYDGTAILGTVTLAPGQTAVFSRRYYPQYGGADAFCDTQLVDVYVQSGVPSLWTRTYEEAAYTFPAPALIDTYA